MKRPPRDPEEKLFSMVLVTRSLAQGCLAFAAIGGLYLAGLLHGLEHDTLRTMTFTALVATIMALVFASRAFSASLRHAFVRNNKTFRYVAMLIVGGTLIILTVPFFRDTLKFVPLSVMDLLAACLAGAIVLIGCELIKGRASALSRH